MLKSTAGGGGIGMQLCRDAARTSRRCSTASRAWRADNFGDAGIFLETFVARGPPHRGADLRRRQGQRRRARRARLLGAAAQPEGHRGNAGAEPAGRDARGAAARRPCRLGRSVNYASAGTVEFVYDADARRVLLPRGEHAPAGRASRDRGGLRRRSRRMDDPPGGRRIAAARPGCASTPRGACDRGAALRRGSRRAISARAPGSLTHVALPADARVETWIESGSEVSPFYDPMLAKLIVTAPTAPMRCASCQAALDATAVARHRDQSRLSARNCRVTTFFARGAMLDRRRLQSFAYRAAHDRGARARHADDPAGLARAPRLLGRRRAAVRARWTPLSFRLANRLRRQRRERGRAGDARSPGPTLQFNCDTRRSASAAPTWRRRSTASRLPYWQAVDVKAGQVLALGRIDGRRPAHLSRRARRLRRARLSRQPLDLHARRLRRPRAGAR